MTLTQGCLLALGRALVIALLASWLARPIAALLLTPGKPWRRRLAWACVLAPLLTPSLLIGYAYIHFAMPLVKYPLLHEGLYVLLVLMKLVPIGALVVCFAPPPAMTDAAVHCRRLLAASGAAKSRRWWRNWLGLLPYWLRGRGRSVAAAFAAVFLLAFGEFEIASLLEIRIGLRQNVGTWTVWLYDLQAGGMPLARTLRYALLPVAIELVVVGLVLVLLLRQRRWGAGAPVDPVRQTKVRRVVAWCYVAAALLIVSIVPAVVVLRWGLAGWRGLVADPTMLGEMRHSLFFGAAGAVVAYLAGRALLATKRGGIGVGRAVAIVGACVPGLLGSLVLGLLVLAAFQLTPLNLAYDTALPLIVALALLLLPLAVVLTLVLLPSRPASSDHAVDLLGQGPAKPFQAAARRLVWETRHRRVFAVLFLLFYFAFLDLSASALLAPTTMQTVTVRMYNLMHFGRTAVLATLLCATVLVPAVILLCAAAGGGLARIGLPLSFRVGRRVAAPGEQRSSGP